MSQVLFLLVAGAASVPAGARERLAVVYPHSWHERVALVDAGMKPILNMDEYLLVKITDDRIPLLPVGRFQMLDTNPSSALYYLVRPAAGGDTAPAVDVSRYGRVLFSRAGDCLLNVAPGAEERLWRTGWRLRRLGAEVRIKPVEEPAPTGMSVSSDTLIAAMVGKVDSLNYLAHVRRLVNFKTRFSNTDSCKKAADYLRARYEGFSLSPEFENFRIDFAPNVVATLTGATEPGVQVIVCGHFDAFNQREDPSLVAPGADDNGSGSAALVEIARILKQYRFARTVKFIDFAGEEQGLFGSIAYADSVARKRDSIIGVFNLDMIANVNGAESLQVFCDSHSTRLADTLIAYAQAYAAGLAPRKVIKYYPYSDHAPFADKGYQAVLGIELSIERGTNPTYHTSADTIGAGFNSLSFATGVVKAVVAATAGLAKPLGVAAGEENRVAAGVTPSVRVEPDPNRGRLAVVYALPAAGHVSVRVYNAAGGRVGLAYDGTRAAGHHRLLLDTRRLPSGVYFLTFKDNTCSTTRRFTCVN